MPRNKTSKKSTPSGSSNNVKKTSEKQDSGDKQMMIDLLERYESVVKELEILKADKSSSIEDTPKIPLMLQDIKKDNKKILKQNKKQENSKKSVTIEIESDCQESESEDHIKKVKY